MRKEVPIAISFVAGVLIIFEYFFKVPSVSDAATAVQNWGSIVSAFAMGLAAANLIVIHARKIRSKHPDAWMSYLVYLGIVAMLVTGSARDSDSPLRSLYSLIYDGMYLPLNASMFSIMVFFIASAARRSFRARNIDAAFLLVAGLLVLLGNAPLTALMSSWFPKAGGWFMNYANVSGNRAIMIGAALGMVLTGFRVIVGLDRSYFGGE
ncbi:MAG TPA: hypothetical protein GXX23_09520 [Firmicutes bacterium]|nr:hypothetical protein [Candidatus Fermentithermobacillaceae bacterium]